MSKNRELPEHIQNRINNMPEHSYGVNRVILTLKDGTVIPDVYVGWGMDVLKVGKNTEVDFDASDVVAVEHQP
jgi:hypothetical protein